MIDGVWGVAFISTCVKSITIILSCALHLKGVSNLSLVELSYHAKAPSLGMASDRFRAPHNLAT